MREMAESSRSAMTKADLISVVAKRLDITQVQAGIIQFEAPIHVSNVMLICPNCDERTRVRLRREGGEAIRVCKKCGEDID